MQHADRRLAFSNPGVDNILLLAQCAGDSIVVSDYQNRILFANPSVANLTKYSQREIKSLRLDQLFKVHHKSWLRPEEKYTGFHRKYLHHGFKAQIIQKQAKAIAVKGTSAKTKWISQPAIILIFNAINQTNQKEKALKHGIKKMGNLIDSKSRKLGKLQKALDEKKQEVTHLNKELMDNNGALSALARHLDKEKKAFESEISRSVVTNILPILKTLQQDNKLSRYALELNLLESYIGALSPDGLKNQGMFCCLSETEGQIATLIKKGMTSKKIAALLCISSETVRTHRKNIRKKLKIQNTDVNLRTYLNQNL